jgi:cyclopropane fatty-acyl-phospholipid synthase-like methyltransferase
MRNYNEYWSKQKTPRYPINSDKFLNVHAAELEILWGDLQGKTILEIGCGNGHLFNFTRYKPDENYHGVDLSAEMLASFKKSYNKINYYKGDVLELKYLKTMRFDVIICNQVIQYIEKEKHIEFFELVYDILSDDGSFCLTGFQDFNLKRVYMSESQTPESKQFSLIYRFLKLFKSFFISPNGYWHTTDYLRKLGLSVGFKSSESWGSMAYKYRSHIKYIK